MFVNIVMFIFFIGLFLVTPPFVIIMCITDMDGPVFVVALILESLCFLLPLCILIIHFLSLAFLRG